jgi:hypothetical protein
MKHKVIFPESAKTALQASYQQFVIHHRAQRRAKQLAWALAAVGVVCGLAWSVPVWASLVPPPMQQATASVLLAATAFAALGVLSGWRAWHSHQRLKTEPEQRLKNDWGIALTAHGPHVQAHMTVNRAFRVDEPIDLMAAGSFGAITREQHQALVRTMDRNWVLERMTQDDAWLGVRAKHRARYLLRSNYPGSEAAPHFVVHISEADFVTIDAVEPVTATDEAQSRTRLQMVFQNRVGATADAPLLALQQALEARHMLPLDTAVYLQLKALWLASAAPRTPHAP